MALVERRASWPREEGTYPRLSEGDRRRLLDVALWAIHEGLDGCSGCFGAVGSGRPAAYTSRILDVDVTDFGVTDLWG